MARKITIDTITGFCKVAGLPHPSSNALCVVRLENILWKPDSERTSIIRDFYIIALKKDVNTKIRYGQQDMNGIGSFLHFMAPKQVLTIYSAAENVTNNGWLLLIHRDFLWNTSLVKKIKQYDYFNYQFNQVLPLNPAEEAMIGAVFQQIEQEQHQLKINHTKDIVLAHVELLLAYANRCYQERQLNLTKKQGHHILAQLEMLLNHCLQDPELSIKGIPTVKSLSDELHLSPNYLSRLVQSSTGQSTQQFLQDRLITLAQEKISTTSCSISEIAYQLGFKSPQSFSRLFKLKTQQTPTEFRSAF
jgi:AraC-like DNA-binding protein